MTDLDLAGLFDFLADRRGARVLLEAGVDKGTAERPELTFPLSVHVVLGKVTREEGVGPGMTIQLRGTAGEKDRLWLDPKRIDSIERVSPTVVRIRLAGGAFISVAGATRVGGT